MKRVGVGKRPSFGAVVCRCVERSSRALTNVRGVLIVVPMSTPNTKDNDMHTTHAHAIGSIVSYEDMATEQRRTAEIIGLNDNPWTPYTIQYDDGSIVGADLAQSGWRVNDAHDLEARAAAALEALRSAGYDPAENMRRYEQGRISRVISRKPKTVL